MGQSPRRRARELVLQALYAREFGDSADDRGLDEMLSAEGVKEENQLFATRLYAATLQQTAHADGYIAELAANWDLRRIAAIDRVILRMAMAELMELTDSPVKVVINEAIELAKTYSTTNSSGFVNGILDSFAKRYPRREVG